MSTRQPNILQETANNRSKEDIFSKRKKEKKEGKEKKRKKKTKEKHGRMMKSSKMFCPLTGIKISEKHSVVFQSLWFLFGAFLFASLTNTFVEEIFEEEVKYVNG
ncbi:hypothetical protein Avbf_10386 [Armadillidium vulgare]|nr:hypothetical protein Avbf_10386 [Armadillidium vulgare]